MMNELILNRPDEQINKSQSYSVFVNDEHFTELKNGGQRTIAVDTDKVTLKAKLRWCGSQSKTFQFDEGNNLNVNIQGNRFYNRIGIVWSLLLIALVALSSLFSSFQAVKYIIPAIIMLMVIYVIYTLTLNKDSWINISEL